MNLSALLARLRPEKAAMTDAADKPAPAAFPQGTPEVYLPSGNPMDPKRMEAKLARDFGPGFSFASYERADQRKYSEQPLQETLLEELPETVPGKTVQLRLYRRNDGGRSLRLQTDIPTFDSEDREWDSWHALYLLLSDGYEQDLHAVYATGGYRLADYVVCRSLKTRPDWLQEVLNRLEPESS